MEETKYRLWLNMVFGTGNHRIWEIMNFFRTAEKAYTVLTSGSPMISLSENEMKNVHAIPIRNAEIFLENCAKRGIGVVSFESAEYPHQLRHIYNPPSVLYYRGNISCLRTEFTASAVGTRKPSAYSLKAAKEICTELSMRGVVIISGFAVGIDIACSMAAAEIGRPSVNVMGCGIDVDYPKPNFACRDAILAAGGVFISEFPPGTQPFSPNFPKRNRILAALGKAVVVFQAGNKSGSLITANLAAGQGRDVLCLPPSDIFSGEYSGNIRLLRDGAIPVYDTSDIMECITGRNSLSVISETVRNGADTDAFIPYTSENTAQNDKLTKISDERITTDDNEKKRSAAYEMLLPGELSIQQKRIAEALSDGAMHADELALRLGLDTSGLMTELTELEIFGVIRSLPGKMYELIR